MKLILTSNAHPNDLYKDGLQRQKFIKSMDILKEKILVYKLEGDIDYRTKNFIEVDDNIKSAYSEEEIDKLIRNNYGSEPNNTNYIKTICYFIKIWTITIICRSYSIIIN